MDSLMSRPDRRSVTKFLSRLRDDSEPANVDARVKRFAAGQKPKEGGGY